MPRTAKGPDGPKNVTVSVRVSPKVRFGLEMMARLNHRTIPEIVSDAIDDALGHEIFGLWDDRGPHPEVGGKRHILNVLWAERPSDRFANIALECPELLSGPEKQLWMRVLSDKKFWGASKSRTSADLRREVLAERWDEIGGEAAVPSHFPGQRRATQDR